MSKYNIILFHGLGTSKYDWKTYYNSDKKKFLNHNLLIELKKLGNVINDSVPYVNVYYYLRDENYREMYNPLNKLLLEDLDLPTYVKKYHKILIEKNIKPPYIIIAHSHGIYYAMEFVRQFKSECKFVVSLDGSWISRELCLKRKKDWKRKNKIPIPFKDQIELNHVVHQIKNNKNNQKYIDRVMNYVRYSHTLYCLKYNYQKLLIPLIIFRDIDMTLDNTKSLLESEELEKINGLNNLDIYYFIDASHRVWIEEKYKKQIVKVIKCYL